jgi:hypothetical protein
MYDSFKTKYRKYVKCYFASRIDEFIDSLEDENTIAELIEQCKRQLKRPEGEFDDVKVNPLNSPKDILKYLVKKLPKDINAFFDIANMAELEEELLIQNSTNQKKEIIASLINDAFDEYFKDSGHLSGHYLRNQYYVLDTIENSKSLSEDEKEYYFYLYRSHISAYELVIMFYNSISKMSLMGDTKKKHNSYRYYIKRYKMLDDLEKVNFIHAEYFQKYRYDLIQVEETGKQ